VCIRRRGGFDPGGEAPSKRHVVEGERDAEQGRQPGDLDAGDVELGRETGVIYGNLAWPRSASRRTNSSA
jgi:hypothetical protein